MPQVNVKDVEPVFVAAHKRETAGADRDGTASLVAQRQASLREAYERDPDRAIVTKRAWAVSAANADALHGSVLPEKHYGVRWEYGIDRAVGGFHDAPNPGEMLCAALAACAHASTRMVADVLRVELASLEVEVTGDVDVRGCMAVGRGVPVGFRSMHCAVRATAAPGTRRESLDLLVRLGEQSCVNLATLRGELEVTTELHTRVQGRESSGA